jgi:predicted flap endonuclease-1-like 5' DNA nuclease
MNQEEQLDKLGRLDKLTDQLTTQVKGIDKWLQEQYGDLYDLELKVPSTTRGKLQMWRQKFLDWLRRRLGLDKKPKLDKNRLEEFQRRVQEIAHWLEEQRGYTGDFSRVLEAESQSIARRRNSAADQFRGALPWSVEKLLRQDPANRGPIGLGLSGGGICSATFNLGLLQGLAKYRILPWVDYMTSTSGGGFPAACMTSLLSMVREDGSPGEHYFNTQWERFPFNPQREIFNGQRVAEYKDVTGQWVLKRGRNRQLEYLRNRGNWVVPRMGLASRDMLRAIGAVLMRPVYTVLVFLLGLLVVAAIHYGITATLTPSIVQDSSSSERQESQVTPQLTHLHVTLQVDDQQFAVDLPLGDPEEQKTADRSELLRLIFGNYQTEREEYGSTLLVGIGVALLIGGLLTICYPRFAGTTRRLSRDDFRRLRKVVGGAFLLLLALAFGVWIARYQALPKQFESVEFAQVLTTLIDFTENEQGKTYGPRFFWVWTLLLAAMAGIAAEFVFKRAADDSWRRWGLPAQLRFDYLVIGAALRLFVWAMLLWIFWLRLRSFPVDGAGPHIFWIWLPAVFTVGALIGFLGFRILRLTRPVRDFFDEVFLISTWASPEFRSVFAALQGMAAYGLVALLALALVQLPLYSGVGVGTEGNSSLPLAILSSLSALALSYASGKDRPQVGGGVSRVFSLLGWLRDYVLGVLVIAANLLLIFVMEWRIDQLLPVRPFLVAGGALLGLVALSSCYNLNFLSPHLLFRDRIAEVCLKTEVETEGGEVEEARDDRRIRLADITPDNWEDKPCSAPYHIVHATLNYPGTWRLTPKDRKSEPFIFANEYCGSRATGYVQTHPDYRDGETLYAHAIGLSGAGASPGMGFQTSLAPAFAMTFLNVRLGGWVANPRLYQPGVPHATARYHDAEHSALWHIYLWDEARAQISERRQLIHLSDGELTGDTIGLYPLFQRRCRFIIAGDGSGDPAGTGQGLYCVLRQVRQDMGIEVDINIEGTKPQEYDPQKKVARESKRHFAVGRITYPATDEHPKEEHGWLVYFKPTVTEKDPGAIRAYWAKHKTEFPIPTSADQFFDEEQWEVQRWVGELAVESMLEDLKAYYQKRIEKEGDDSRSWDSDRVKELKDSKNLLDALLREQRIDGEIIANHPGLLEQFMEALYAISNDVESTEEEAPVKQAPKAGAPITDIKGIGKYSQKLKKAGIATTQDLLEACATPKQREELAAKTKISAKLILEFANRADLFRIRGVGKEYSDLLEEAGVNTVVQLAQRNPESLHRDLKDTNQNMKKPVGRLPTLKQVKAWIQHAKSLPRILTY